MQETEPHPGMKLVQLPSRRSWDTPNIKFNFQGHGDDSVGLVRVGAVVHLDRFEVGALDLGIEKELVVVGLLRCFEEGFGVGDKDRLSFTKIQFVSFYFI